MCSWKIASTERELVHFGQLSRTVQREGERKQQKKSHKCTQNTIKCRDSFPKLYCSICIIHLHRCVHNTLTAACSVFCSCSSSSSSWPLFCCCCCCCLLRLLFVFNYVRFISKIKANRLLCQTYTQTHMSGFYTLSVCVYVCLPMSFSFPAYLLNGCSLDVHIQAFYFLFF